MLAAGPLGQCAMTAQALRRLDSASSVLLEVRGVALNFYLSLFFSVGYSSSSIAPLVGSGLERGVRVGVHVFRRAPGANWYFFLVDGSPDRALWCATMLTLAPVFQCMAPTRGGSLATFAQFDMVGS